jgi:membrane protein implicated in regulation of membrane protease activity
MLTLIGIGLAAFVLEGPWRWVAIAVGATLDTAENGVRWWWSRRRRPQVGVERLRGATAVVLTPCRPLGQVRVAGEVWRAECPEGADPGAQVEVVAVDEPTLTLTVRDPRR